MKIVLAGGSGTLGSAIAGRLVEQGHDVVVLTRAPTRPVGVPCRQVGWDGRTVGAWRDELAGAAVINLAGALVDRRPTARNLALLRNSRVEPTKALVEASRQVGQQPVVWLQASTAAIYGDRGDEIITEDSSLGAGLPQQVGVATAWEEAAADARTARMVTMRIGIVLEAGAPALDRLDGLVRWGLGGRVGSGRQWVSWIHVADFLRVVDLALTGPLEGIVNVTAPEPVTNATLMAELRRSLHRPAAPPTPAALVHLGALLMRTDPALALTGRRCLPTRLQQAGFHFGFPDLRRALEDLRETAEQRP